jgi:riboflavin synthase
MDYSQSLIDKFQIEMAEVKTKPAEVPGLSELTTAITKMAEQNQELVKTLTRRPV